MKMVLLIGTSHKYQLPAHSAAAEFQEFLIATCVRFGVRAIAEEMSLDGLTDKIHRSICAEIAESRAVPHRYCDLDRAQRQVLGIKQDNDIKGAAFLQNWDQPRIDREIKISHAIRESHWLGQILGMDR